MNTVIKVHVPQTTDGDVLLFSAEKLAGLDSVLLERDFFLAQGRNGWFSVGGIFCEAHHHHGLLQVIGRHYLPGITGKMTEAVFIRCLAPLEARGYVLARLPRAYSLAVITLSDKGAAGLREDESGPLVLSLVKSSLALQASQHFILPDDPLLLRALVANLALQQHVDLIITTGGTGLTSRDTTPEALLPLFSRHLHGFTQAMMAVSLAKTPHAVLSRAVAGIVGESIVVTLPGSKKAAKENLEVLLPALDHALAKLHDDVSDCGHVAG